jgi:acyl-CoA thioesterase
VSVPVIANSVFARDTELSTLGSGSYRAELNRNWWVIAGPNGGLLAALLLRAVEAEVGRRDVGQGRSVRTMTVHYLAPSVEGDAELEVEVDKHGRSVSFATVTLSQQGRLIAKALVLLAAERPAVREWQQRHLPSVLDLGDSFLAVDGLDEVPLRERWDQRWAIGVPGFPDTNPEGLLQVGGWTRLADPHPYDGAVLAAMTDSWVPAVIVHEDARLTSPTLELTIHFRTDPARLGLGPEDHVLAVFRQETGSEGYLDESGELWSADGRLLVVCRQLGAVLERPDEAEPKEFLFSR